MRTDKWREAWELYRAGEDDLPGADTEVSRRVEALRSAEPELEASLREEDARTLPAAIGPYRIIRRLDEGGMGLVFEAEQEQPRRRVALKIIRPGLATRDLLRRFEVEAQVLGRLQHPGIAQIFQAGTADHGYGPQPYFAMEYIEGLPLTRHAAEAELPLAERLQLLIRICEAVAHAHERGIIHRDLKPGNILVDRHGQPKVLDFGVARVTDAEVQATRHTDVGFLIGTLAYMSPEQLRADPLEIDTRTDVYALGVLLFELATGRLPYDTKGRTLAETLRLMEDGEPARLRTLDRKLTGDLETIAAKALEKDRTRRYGSAAELAGDLRRYLNHEPILARPASRRLSATQVRRPATKGWCPPRRRCCWCWWRAC